MDWRERIVVDPLICHGQACIKGTRVLVAALLDSLAAGVTAQEILLSYPSLTADDLEAAAAYAAELGRARVVPLPEGAGA